MSFVSFQNADKRPLVKDKKKIKQFIPLLFSEYGYILSTLTIVFCSDEFLLSLNQKFLQHDYYTDIITFDLSSDKEKMGEVYISVDRVRENAISVDSPFQQELLRVMFHGSLHLCGFSDKTQVQKKEMTKHENYALTKFDAFHVKQ